MKNSIRLLVITLIILVGFVIGRELYTKELYEQHKLNREVRKDKREIRKGIKSKQKEDIDAHGFYTKAHMQRYIRLK